MYIPKSCWKPYMKIAQRKGPPLCNLLGHVAADDLPGQETQPEPAWRRQQVDLESGSSMCGTEWLFRGLVWFELRLRKEITCWLPGSMLIGSTSVASFIKDLHRLTWISFWDVPYCVFHLVSTYVWWWRIISQGVFVIPLFSLTLTDNYQKIPLIFLLLMDFISQLLCFWCGLWVYCEY